MINKISSIYGIKPSIFASKKILIEVLALIAFAGASEMAIEEISGEIAVNAMIASRLSQGIGAAIFTIRIGFVTQKIVRVLEFSDTRQPKIKDIISSVSSSIRSIKFSK